MRHLELALLLALTIARPAEAQSPAPETATPAAQSLAALMAADARLQTIGWRLASSNAAFCPDAPLAIGLQLFDALNYRDPPAMRAALGLESDIAVDAVATGSPAERAGLSTGDEVLAIGGWAMVDLPPVPAGDYARLVSLHDRIDAVLAAERKISLTLRRLGEISMTGEPACRARFELSPNGSKAGSDGSRVRIREDFLAKISDDDQAAAAVAHELAHNILRHPQLLSVNGRKASAVRATETEADRLAPWLMANAGFDPGAAIHFGEARERVELPGIFRAPTHDGWEKRLVAISEEVAAIAATRKSGAAGPLDWRSRFGDALARARQAPAFSK